MILDLEGKRMSLEKDLTAKLEIIEDTQDQLTQNIKQKEDLISRLTDLEDNYQKGEMLREQFKLKLQQAQ